MPKYFLLLTLFLSACANAPSGGKDTVRFISSPEGATMTASTGFTCVTPCQTQIRRDEEFTAVFTLPGYASAEVPVGTKPMSEGKSYSLGPLSVGVATASVVEDPNGLYTTEHTPNPVVVELQPIAASSGR